MQLESECWFCCLGGEKLLDAANSVQLKKAAGLCMGDVFSATLNMMLRFLAEDAGGTLSDPILMFGAMMQETFIDCRSRNSVFLSFSSS